MLDHPPERDRPEVKRRLRRAWARDDHQQALAELQVLVRGDVPHMDGRRMLEAERQFRRIAGYDDLAKLALTVAREIAQPTTTHTTEEAATLITV